VVGPVSIVTSPTIAPARLRPGRGVPPPLRLQARRSPRRPLLAVGSLVLVVASAAGFASLYARAGGRVAVLEVVRAVPAGASIEERDVTSVRVTLAPSVNAVGLSALHRVVGRRAAFPLVPGTLLSPADVARGPGLTPGDALVGVATKPGQLPAAGVQPGDVVAVLLTTQPGETLPELGASTSGAPADDGGSSVTGTVIAPQATVREVTSPASGDAGSAGDGTTVVSVVVPAGLAPAVASASAAGQAALVIVDPGS